MYLIRTLLSSLRHLANRFWLPRKGNLSGALHTYFDGREISFIQLGANDGKSGDHMYPLVSKNKWRGILVEPQRDVFQKLLSTYKDKKLLLFENCAVDIVTSEKDIFYVDFPGLRGLTGLTSFVKENIYEHFNNGYIKKILTKNGIEGDIDPDLVIKSYKVPCLTIQDLMGKNGFLSLDLLAMDLEGYDCVIINSINFKVLKPKMIVFESKYEKFDDYKKTLLNLYKHNYINYRDGQNVYSILKQ